MIPHSGWCSARLAGPTSHSSSNLDIKISKIIVPAGIVGHLCSVFCKSTKKLVIVMRQ